MSSAVYPDAQACIDGIAPGHRPLFDRIHRLILSLQPAITVVLAYRMPAYQAGHRRLYVGARSTASHCTAGRRGDDGGFTARHPQLLAGKGTIRLRPEDAARISDGELRDLIRAALKPD
jgi:hypothetical protein